MNKIYNLQETIYNEQQEIALLEKQLHFRKGILKTHEQALESMLSPKEYSPYSKEKTSVSVTEKQQTPLEERNVSKERITLENWKDLGIEIGDKVEIVVSGDDDFGESVYNVTDVEDLNYEDILFIEIGDEWYRYDYNLEACDELYLIRTKEGSLNDNN